MADFSEDTMLAHAFADLRHEMGPEVRPIGVDAARATVRHRKRVHATVIAVVAAIAVLVPVGAFATVANTPNHGPQLGTSPTQEQTPSPTRTPTASAVATAAPDGRFTMDELQNATLTIPAWAADANRQDCLTGQVTFSGWLKGVHEDLQMSISSQGYADVDGDGAQETLVLVKCNDDAIGTQQVIAIDRDASGGILTVGQVAAQSGAVKTICGARTGTGGAVDVQVVDFALSPVEDCTPQTAPYAIFQWRTYPRVAGSFQQTGGDATLPRNPKVSDLTVNASTLTFTAPAAGTVPNLTGTMTVTVHRAGHAALASTITVSLVRGTTVSAPANCTETDYAQGTDVVCQVASVAPGVSRPLTLTLSMVAPTKPDFLPEVQVHPVDGYADPDMSNNTAQFSIVFP